MTLIDKRHLRGYCEKMYIMSTIKLKSEKGIEEL